MKKIDAWHFVGADHRLAHGSGLEVAPGSRHVYDALYHAPGPWLCRVRIWGDDVMEGDNKLAGRHREVLDMRDVSSELRLWGCWCVRQLWDKLTDERSRNAVEIAERFAVGRASEEELSAAFSAAAKAVEMEAAMEPGRDVARLLAAWAAVWTTALRVETARTAATVASAAAMADWATAWGKQSAELESRMRTLFGLEGIH